MSFKLTKQLAAQLGEVASVPFAQIRRIIELGGAETAQALADEAVTIAAGDGMLTPDGKPRTVGGIFFHLARQRLPPEIVQEVWMTWARRKQLQRERAGLPPLDPQAPPTPRAAPEAAPGPALPVFRWEDTAAIYRELATEKGAVQSMKVTLIGRPGRIVEKQDLVITMMTQMEAPKSFPKGVPAPPATPTVYTVYIAAKQWKNVAEAMQNPEDRLIVEGFAAFDPSLEGMAVYVSSTTTKILQQQKRQPA
jgi:hypothetical protein